MDDLDKILKEVDATERKLESLRTRLQEWITLHLEPYSTREAADRLGVSHAYIQNLRRGEGSGKGKLRTSTMVQIAEKIRTVDAV
ncbi:MAG: hypothetical protein RH862_20435 [Leptospiraceae bacterium]